MKDIDQQFTGLTFFVTSVEIIVLLCCLCCFCSLECCFIIPCLVKRIFPKKKLHTQHERLEDEEENSIEFKTEKKVEEKKEVDDLWKENVYFGMMSCCCLFSCPILGSFFLFLYRVVCFTFLFFFNISVLIVNVEKYSSYFIFGTYQHLTMVSFSFLLIYYFFSSIYSFLYFISRLACIFRINRKYCCCFYYLEYFVFLLFETSLLSSIFVTGMFWMVDVPFEDATSKTFDFGVFTLPLHGVNSLFTLLEFFSLHFLYIPFTHIFWTSSYLWCYSLFATFLVKTTLIEEYPYKGLLSYDKNTYAIFVRWGGALFFSLLHLSFALISFVRYCFFWSIRSVRRKFSRKKREKDEVVAILEDMELNDFEQLALDMEMEFEETGENDQSTNVENLNKFCGNSENEDGKSNVLGGGDMEEIVSRDDMSDRILSDGDEHISTDSDGSDGEVEIDEEKKEDFN